MKKREPVYGWGTVSEGTHREEDLIPSFVSELEYLIKANGKTLRGKSWKELREINKRMASPEYYESEQARFDLDYLFDSLDEFAPPYFYFGAHPGDGVNYGFWLPGNFSAKFDGLKVDDLSDVPRDYRGEVLHVNDHGNLSLYVKNSRGFREIWAIV